MIAVASSSSSPSKGGEGGKRQDPPPPPAQYFTQPDHLARIYPGTAEIEPAQGGAGFAAAAGRFTPVS